MRAFSSLRTWFLPFFILIFVSVPSLVLAKGISLESWVSDDHADAWHLHETVSALEGEWTPFVGDDGNGAVGSSASDDQGFKIRGRLDGEPDATLWIDSWTSADHVNDWNLHEIVSAPSGTWTPFVGDDDNTPNDDIIRSILWWTENLSVSNAVDSDDQAFKIRAKVDDNAAGDYSGCSITLESWTSDDHEDYWHLHEIESAPVGSWTAYVGDDGNGAVGSSASDDQGFKIRMKLDCPDPVIDASCGVANGVPVSSAPIADLCSAGTPSAVATNASSYDWTCSGENGGTDASCFAPKAASLEICEQISGSFYPRSEWAAITSLGSGGTVTLKAFYDTATGDCAGTEVTNDPGTVWTENFDPDDAFTVSPGLVSAAAKPGEVRNGSMGVTYAGQARNLYLPGYCNWTASCTDRESDYCSGEEFDITDPVCSGTKTCAGTRNCNFNWREVAPGE